jgi:ABC-type multidrug transport system fused ATPase/permease subunit
VNNWMDLLKKRISLMKTLRMHMEQSTQYFILRFACKLLLFLSAIAAPVLFKILIDDVMIAGDLSNLIVICIGLAILYLIDTAVILAERYLKNKHFLKASYKIRCKVWKNYVHMPYEKAEQFNPGDIKNRIDSDINKFSELIQVQLVDYLYSLVSAVSLGVIAVVLNWKLALFGLGMVPLSFWLTKRLGTGLGKTSEAFRATWGKYEAWLQGSLQAWKEIKSLNATKKEERTFTHYWHTLSLQFFKRQIYWYGNRGFIAIKNFFITKMNLYFIGGLLIFAGELTIGGLLVFMKYYEQFFTAIGSVTNADMHLYDFMPSLQRIMEMLDESASQGMETDRKTPAPESGHILLHDVSFSYPHKEEKALDGINLHVGKGEKLAVVGRSGSGKSSLIKLILGLYKPDSGEVLFNGVNINEQASNSLHSSIGAVMQDSMIFNLTIRENLLLAKPQANDKELMEACHSACLDDFVESLPNKLNTLVGEKGIKLSGGQRQRMAIARIILVKPQMIIFDEATSNLDHQTEKAIHNAIAELAKDRTVIIVAHRLSSILNADRVVVMDQGKIVAEGCHESLRGKHEVYDTLFSGQLRDGL